MLGRFTALAIVVVAVAPGFALGEGATSRFVTRAVIEVGTDGHETITIDIESYGSWIGGYYLPGGSTLLAAQEDHAPVSPTVRNESGSTLYLPEGQPYHLQLSLSREAPPASFHPFYSASLFAGGFEGAANSIEVEVRVPAGWRLFHGTPGGVSQDGRVARAVSTQGLRFAYAYERPFDATELAAVEEGIYRIVGPARLERWMREVARLATTGSHAAAAQAGLDLQPPYHVRYAAEEVFGWEDGFYDDGIIAIRRSSVNGGISDGHPWNAAGTLVHETFHAVSVGERAWDASTTWWVEGSARNAERYVSGDDGWRMCDTAWCWSFEPQLSRASFERVVKGETPFNLTWSNSGISDASVRSLHYKYSSFIVGAYIARYGEAAYRAAWRDVDRGWASSNCICDERWLVEILARHANQSLTPADLSDPFGNVRGRDVGLARNALEPLLADDFLDGGPKAVPGGIARVASDSGLPTNLTQRWSPRLAFVTHPARQDVAVEFSVEVENVSLPAQGGILLPDATWGTIVVRLDDAPVDPVVKVSGTRANVTIARVSGGTHTLSVEVVGPASRPFSPAARLDATFYVEPQPSISVEPILDATRLRVDVLVVDATSQVPLPGQSVELLLDGEPARALLTDANGKASATLPRPVPGRHDLVARTRGGEGYARLSVPRLEEEPTATAPNVESRGGTLEAAALESTEAADAAPERTPLPWLACLLAGAVAAALRRRG